MREDAGWTECMNTIDGYTSPEDAYTIKHNTQYQVDRKEINKTLYGDTLERK